MVKAALAGLVLLSLAGAPAFAQAPSSDLPTPKTPSANPGAAATDAITNPAKPVEAPPPPGTVPAETRSPPPASAPSGSGPRSELSPADMRELVEAARATAKATRESVDYGRVVPDILTQVLAKLDKLENKLDKIEDLLRAQRARR